MEQNSVGIVICDGMSVVGRFVKRSFDILCSLFGMICLSPAYLVIYIALRRQGDGPVIYRQERIGYKGKPFYILKVDFIISLGAVAYFHRADSRADISAEKLIGKYIAFAR